ncbi:hypothetical protein [Streptomyces sp. NPDC002785]|uniref:hypothetical protein n=1 Tax=Streptomyces sp. NPDC002785 TaxID=3154543 RepID=UPI003327D093
MFPSVARQAAAALRVVAYAPADAGAPVSGERLGPRQRADALRLLDSLEQVLPGALLRPGRKGGRTTTEGPRT